MRPLALLSSVILAVATVTVAACGGDSAGTVEQPAEAKVGAPLDPLAGPGGSMCSVNTDCSPGQECRLVRVGELQQYVCVDGLANEDAAAPKPITDAGQPPSADAAKKSDALPPKPVTASDSGVDCARALSVTVTTKEPSATTCVFNSGVETQNSWLVYVCAGGAAKATFGDQTFSGSVSNGVVTVTNVDTYDQAVPNTGTSCNYTSTQTITGTLASGTLQYSYTEALTKGEPIICNFLLRPCSQSGPVSVGPISSSN